MPLGLELAAAWVEMLPLAEIAAQIARSADFLAADFRDLPERQRSMHAVFDWSWRLLGADEQRILCQLTVFRGEFTIGQPKGWPKPACRVCSGSSKNHCCGSTTGGTKCTICCASSPPNSWTPTSAPRYGGATRPTIWRWPKKWRRHRPGQSTPPPWRGSRASTTICGRRWRGAWKTESVVSGSLLVAEHVGQSTTRLGLRYPDQGIGQANSREPRTTNHGQRIELGLRLAGALWPFWERYCHLSEGRRWLERFLEDEGAGAVAPEVRAIALIGAGCLAQDQDDYARADALFAEGLRLERMLGRTDRVTRVLANRGITVRAQGQYAQATALLEECLAVARAAGDRADIAYVLRRLGGVMRERGDYARAANHLSGVPGHLSGAGRPQRGGQCAAGPERHRARPGRRRNDRGLQRARV